MERNRIHETGIGMDVDRYDVFVGGMRSDIICGENGIGRTKSDRYGNRRNG